MDIIEYLERNSNQGAKEEPIHAKLLDDISNNLEKAGVVGERRVFREVNLVGIMGRVDLVILTENALYAVEGKVTRKGSRKNVGGLKEN